MVDAERQKLVDLIMSSNDPAEIARLCREFALRQNLLVSDGNGGLIAQDESSRAEVGNEQKPRRVSLDDRTIRTTWDPSLLETTESFMKGKKS